MKEETIHSVANTMETIPDFLPYLPELLSDMWALGSSPHLLVELIKPLNLPKEQTTVLDLGCGKGAAAITLAREFKFYATGIDANQDFLNAARLKAAENRVSTLCTFIYQDIFDFLKSSHAFDIAIFASLGGLLGDFSETVGRLRKTIKPGGYILIDDGYLKGTENLKRRGYEHYRPHHEVLRQLQSHGDLLIRELSTDEESKRINDQYLSVLQNKKSDFLKRHPHMKETLEQYIQTQKIECEIIENSLHSALWLIRKKPK